MTSDGDGVKDEPTKKGFILPSDKADNNSDNDDEGGVIHGFLKIKHKGQIIQSNQYILGKVLLTG